MENKTICKRGVLLYISLFAVLILLVLIYIGSWFEITYVTDINRCCEMEFKTTQYFLSVNFSSQELTSEKTTCCRNVSVDDYFNQMNTTIQLKKDTAQSIMKFVQGSLFPIIIQYIMIWCFFCGTCVSKLNQGLLITTTMIILWSIFKYLMGSIIRFHRFLVIAVSTTGVAVYATIYKEQVGFSVEDLGYGWMSAVGLCGLTWIHDLLLIAMHYAEYRQENRKRERLANTDLRHKITTDNWTIVKLGKRKSVLETCMSGDQENVISTIPGNSATIQPNTKDEIMKNYQTFIDAMWNPYLVGKGADAKTLSHKKLKVLSVQHGYSNYKYTRVINIIKKVIRSRGALPRLTDVDCKPIQTTELKDRQPLITIIGMQRLDSRLNEYLLFHGTSEANAENIWKYGFDIFKVKRSFLGRGIYFAESPMKADQYAGAGTTGCMILCRVILGNFVIRKTYPGYEMKKWTHPPCSRCLCVNECDFHGESYRFDSVIYDRPNALFREFVVFNTDQILVESVVKYTRVTDTVFDTK